jgi:hypothetical protein
MCRREDGRRTARDRPHATCSNSRQQTTAGHRRTTSHLGGVTCNNQCTTGKMKQVQEAAPEEADAHVSAGRRAQGAYACRCVTGPVQRATRTVQRATDDVSSVAHHAPRAIQCASTRSRRACAAGMVWHCGEADVATWTPSNVQRAVCNMQRAKCNMQRATCSVQRATCSICGRSASCITTHNRPGHIKPAGEGSARED